MTREEAVKMVVNLRSKRLNWTEIANALEKGGYISKIGKPLTMGGAWGLHPENVKRVQARLVKQLGPKFRRKPKRVNGEVDDSISKWELLRSVEACSDLKPAAKKSLMSMIFDETVG